MKILFLNHCKSSNYKYINFILNIKLVQYLKVNNKIKNELSGLKRMIYRFIFCQMASFSCRLSAAKSKPLSLA